MTQQPQDSKKYLARLAKLDDDTVDTALGAVLHRQDCPDKMVLGDYELGLLAAEAQTQLEAHLSRCPFCQAEIARFAESLTTDEHLTALANLPMANPAESSTPTRTTGRTTSTRTGISSWSKRVAPRCSRR